MPAPQLLYEHFEILTDGQGEPMRLGRGGMGSTFRARDLRLRKEVALKVINDSALASATIRQRFFNEARAAAAIDHPHVARVHYLCGLEAPHCFFAMELIDGLTLAERILQQGKLPPGEALDLLRPVGEALAALGTRKLVHRDIKPENIMITRSAGQVKLIDFGVAKMLEEESDHLVAVHTGRQFVGSVLYASPEQIVGEPPVDQRSDFYSLGATLWYTVVGEPPFSGTRFEVQEGHVHRPPAWEKTRGLHPALVQMLARLLAKQPGGRPVDATALLAEWDKVRAEVGEATSSAPEDLVSTQVEEGTPPLALRYLEPAPTGYAPVPAAARLAALEATGEWVTVRELPHRLSAPALLELQRAAQAVEAAPHSGLLAVYEVRRERIVCAWRRGLLATQLLAARPGGLPVEVVLAWLPQAAAAVDAACAHGFSHLGLSPARWLISPATIEANEESPLHWQPTLETWGLRAQVALDPLAGFDRALSQAQSGEERTLPPEDHGSLRTPADFHAAFGRAVHELLGGHSERLGSPLTALNERRNLLLRELLEGRGEYQSTTAWAAAFVDADEVVGRRAENSGQERQAQMLAASRRPRKTYIWLASTAAAVVAGAIPLYLWSARKPAIPVTKTPQAAAELRPSAVLSATVDEPFRNTLKMTFVPVAIPQPQPETIGSSVGKPAARVLFCQHETRRAEYEIFAVSQPGLSSAWQAPEVSGFKMPAGPEAAGHPVINVPWADAVAFCQWLTEKERSDGFLRPGEYYRLPTDYEWSCAAGLGEREDPQHSPKAKSGLVPDVYPWESSFFAPGDAGSSAPLPGNYAGEEGQGTWSGVIQGYADPFTGTAPVGSFAPNSRGLFDLGGNAWEWCQDVWDTDATSHILRGASCLNSLPNLLNASFRKVEGGDRLDLYGFRCVLVVMPP